MSIGSYAEYQADISCMLEPKASIKSEKLASSLANR